LKGYYSGMLCDWQLEAVVNVTKCIDPFIPQQVARDGGRKLISYGVSSYGYDIRMGTKYKVFNNRRGGLIDPLNFEEIKFLDNEEGDYCDIAPGSYILAATMEHFDLPENMLVKVIGKSTYARCGLIVNVTPGEPEWAGHLTIELANATPCPLRVYANMGIGQMGFELGVIPRTTYKRRATGEGKYMNQGAEPVIPRLVKD
jgi:dCTP deaminase